MQQLQHEETKLWNRNYILILILSTLNQSAAQMVTPFVTKYAINLGATMEFASTISGLFSITALIFRPIAGLLSDRINRKKIILTTNTLTAICMFAYSLVSTPAVLCGVRLMHGVVFSFSAVAAMAFNTMYMPKDKLAEGLGWMGLATILSQAIGPNLGLWLADNYSYNACFYVASAACIATACLILCIPYRAAPKTEQVKKGIKFEDLLSMRIMPYAILAGLFSCGNGLINAFLALMGEERGIANVGLFFTIYSITMVATRPFVGKLQDKRGVKIILYPALAITAVGMVVLGAANALWMVIIAAICKAIGQGSGSPSIQAHCVKQLGREKAGVVSSTTYVGQDLGNFLAPTVGGFIQTRYGYSAVFNVYAASLILVGWVLLFIKLRYDAKKYPDAPC